MAHSNFRAFMKHSFSPLTSRWLLCSILTLAWLPAAQAEKADRDRPMNVSADSMKYDDLKQTSEFSGNVVMSKGTLVLRAAQVVVRQDPQGHQMATATGAPGQKAFFRQKREKVDEWIEGEAQSLIYDSRADTVRFLQGAVIRRYRGATLADESSGHEIVYDNTTDTFTIDGGRKSVSASAQAAGTSSGRVRAVLAPRPSASAAEATPASGSAPGAGLRPSLELSGPKK
jgi:lipopolysaccharide export system protein LptA